MHSKTHAPEDLSHPIYRRLLKEIEAHRFATTHQLARLTLTEYVSERSAKRQTLRHLRTLKSEKLITSLERRVGGWQGGSTVSIWALTPRGFKHLTGSMKRTRSEHLSTGFLEHGLAVTETRVLIEETVRTIESTEAHVQVEPHCWRRYLGQHGITVTLKPDLQLQVMSTKYTDLYFIEVDCGTENPGRVIRKSWQYEQYRRSGAEQEKHGAFPAVIWLVPNGYRRTQLEKHLSKEPKLTPGLFIVITPDALPDLIRSGPT